MMLKLINFQKFHSSKSPVPMEGIDVNKMLTSEGFPDGKTGTNGKKKNFKYFISHKNYEQVKLLCIKLPQMSGYLNGFNY